MLFQRFLALFFTLTLLWKFFDVLASDPAVLSVKARMKVTRSVSVSCKDLLVGNPFRLKEKGVKLENSISVKINYNGYKQMKIVLKQCKI